MRTGNLGTASYTPTTVPDGPDALPAYLQMELQRISAAVTALALGHLDKTYVAPTKPREGDMRLADGTKWNPGSGAGFYGYYGGAWVKLG